MENTADFKWATAFKLYYILWKLLKKSATGARILNGIAWATPFQMHPLV